jgi:hypothetical protein
MMNLAIQVADGPMNGIIVLLAAAELGHERRGGQYDINCKKRRTY